MFTLILNQVIYCIAPFFFAQTDSMSDQVIEMVDQAHVMANKITDSWDVTFNQVMNGGMFLKMLQIGKLFAILGLAFFIVKSFEQIHQGNVGIPLSKLISVSLCLLLLSNNGSLLVGCTTSMKNAVEAITNSVRVQLTSDMNVANAVKAVIMDDKVAEIGKQKARDCLRHSEEEIALDCLGDVVVMIDRAAEKIEEETGVPSFKSNKIGEKFKEWAESTKEYIKSIPANIGFQLQTLLMWVLDAVQEAFIWLLETAMIVLSLASPIAVGLSVFDFQALRSWITGFMSFAAAQIALSLITAVVSLLVINAENPFNFTYSVFLAIFAPAISLSAAGMTGFGVFQTFNNSGATMSLAGNAIKVGLMSGATKGLKSVQQVGIKASSAVSAYLNKKGKNK